MQNKWWKINAIRDCKNHELLRYLCVSHDSFLQEYQFQQCPDHYLSQHQRYGEMVKWIFHLDLYGALVLSDNFYLEHQLVTLVQFCPEAMND